jgi:hypothetical protein
MMRVVTAILGATILAVSANAAPLSFAPPPRTMLLLPVDAPDNSAEKDIDFLFRLGMLEGHLMIGHQLLQAQQPALALPHFGHPVHEIYGDIADYLGKNHFAPFDAQLAALEAKATASPDSPDTEAAYQSVMAIVHRAREIAPATLRASLPAMIQICSDTVDAASGEFGEGLERGQIASIVEYHDSKGYLGYVQQQLDALRSTHKDVPSQSLLDRFQAVLAKAEWIVEPLLPGPTPRASLDDYRAIAAEAAALAKP